MTDEQLRQKTAARGKNRVELIRRRHLDPRQANDARDRPIHDSVNIPLAELPQRTHELPPTHETVSIAAESPLLEKTRKTLESLGRASVSATDWSLSEAPIVGAGRLWEPTHFVAEVLDDLPPGRLLELACGTGRDSVYAASLGWAVTAVDRLPDALERACGLERPLHDRITPISWRALDLETDRLSDLTRDWNGAFDAVVVVRYLHRPLFSLFAQWLRPGGHLVYETFTTTHRARHGKPRRDAFVLQPDEIATLVPSRFSLQHVSEAWRGDVHTARLWATATLTNQA